MWLAASKEPQEECRGQIFVRLHSARTLYVEPKRLVKMSVGHPHRHSKLRPSGSSSRSIFVAVAERPKTSYLRAPQLDPCTGSRHRRTDLQVVVPFPSSIASCHVATHPNLSPCSGATPRPRCLDISNLYLIVGPHA